MLHVYTKSEGRLLVHVYGAHGKHKVRAAYQPLSVVELTYDSQPTRPVPTLATIDSIFLPEQVHGDMRRQAVALFVTEVLLTTLTHPMRDEQLYQFLDDFVHELNGTSTPENMHIYFMLRLAERLGIGVPELFADIDSSAVRTIQLSRHARQEALRQLCEHYMTEIETFTHPKSLDILIEIFD